VDTETSREKGIELKRSKLPDRPENFNEMSGIVRIPGLPGLFSQANVGLMKFSLAGTAGHQVQSYRPGRLQIGEQVYAHSVLLTAARVDPWDVSDMGDLQAAHLEHLLTLEPDVVLLGTGEQQRFPPRSIHRCLAEAQVGLEIMSTAAAVRTFNVLVAEGRHVVAALIV